MHFEISPKQRFCCFDKQTIYQFHPYTECKFGNPCDNCAFRGSVEPLTQSDECFIVPCDCHLRSDKTDGFWQKSTLVDYQQFRKMLAAGG